MPQDVFSAPFLYGQPGQPGAAVSGLDPRSMLGNIATVVDGGPPIQLCQASADDLTCKGMTVTLAASATNGTSLPQNATITAFVYFGNSRAQFGPIKLTIGQGMSFQVPGSVVLITAQMFVTGSSGATAVVSCTINQGMFPKMSIGAPLTAQQTATFVGTTGATVTIPAFTTGVKVMRVDYLSGSYSLAFFNQSSGLSTPNYTYQISPNTDCPWIPVAQGIDAINIIGISSGSNTVQFLFALEL